VPTLGDMVLGRWSG